MSKDTDHTVDAQGCPKKESKKQPNRGGKRAVAASQHSAGTWSWQSMIAGLKRPRIKLGDPAQATSFISRASGSSTSWGANSKQDKLVGDATSFQLNGGLFRPVDGLKSICLSTLQDGGRSQGRKCPGGLEKQVYREDAP